MREVIMIERKTTAAERALDNRVSDLYEAMGNAGAIAEGIKSIAEAKYHLFDPSENPHKLICGLREEQADGIARLATMLTKLAAAAREKDSIAEDEATSGVIAKPAA